TIDYCLLQYLMPETNSLPATQAKMTKVLADVIVSISSYEKRHQFPLACPHVQAVTRYRLVWTWNAAREALHPLRELYEHVRAAKEIRCSWQLYTPCSSMLTPCDITPYTHR